MDSRPEFDADAATSEPGARERGAARAAAGAARSLAAHGGEDGDDRPYRAARRTELLALASRFDELADEAAATAERAVAPSEDRDRLLTRHFDLAFELLEATAATIRLAGVTAAAGGPSSNGVDELRAAALTARSAHGAAGAVAREVGARLAADREVQLRLRVAEAIRAELDELLGELGPGDPSAAAG